MKIFHRFNVVIILVIVFMVSIYSFYSIRSEKQTLTKEMISQSTYYTKMIALGINSASFLNRRDMLVDYIDQMIPQSKGWIKYAVITDLNNYAWIHSVQDLEYETLGDEASQNVVKNLAMHNPYLQIYDNELLQEEILDVSTLITVNLKDRGILRLGFSFANVEKKIRAAIIRSIIMGGLLIVLGIVLSTFLAKHVTRPISRIVGKTKLIAKGKLELPITTGSNILEIKELEESIEEMKRDLKYIYLGGIFADFRHAIKSDLGLISANMQYIRQRAGQMDSTVEIKKKADQVTAKIDYINAEINKFKAYKKPQDVKKVSISINDLLSKIVNSKSGLEKIRIKSNYQSNLPSIIGDLNHLEKALVNIISNAIEAMPKGGTLFIETKQCENKIEICVKDTGCGIAREDLPKIFDPSFSTKKKKGGEGIGLAVTKIIIEDVHQGKIEVESEQGQGTTFNIILKSL